MGKESPADKKNRDAEKHEQKKAVQGLNGN